MTNLAVNIKYHACQTTENWLKKFWETLQYEMKTKRFNLTLLLIITICLSIADLHGQKFSLIKTIDAKDVWEFTTDKLGNLYVADDKVISKYDLNGNFLCSYSDYDFLNFRYLDATDPFKLMLFSPEFQNIRLLDSYFGLSGQLYLFNYPEMGLPALASATDDGNYWIFDRQNLVLRKIDMRGNVLISSTYLYLLYERNYLPTYMHSNRDWIIMNNQNNELLVFDRFGNYYKGVVLDSAEFQQVTGNLLFFIQNNKLIAFNFTELKQSTVETPDLSDVSAIRIESQRLYIFRKNQIEIISTE